MAPITDDLVQLPKIFLSTATMNNCACKIHDNLVNYTLPICRRGPFLQDAFFEYAYDLFDETVRRILERWGEMNFVADLRGDVKLRRSNILSRYRQLRSHNLKEEDQAVTVASDNKSNKIVMDVHDFVHGEVKVKVVGEREVMVEGGLETNKGDFAVSSNTFRRRFCLPQDTNMEAISSAMSSDGVLSITAPNMLKHKLQGQKNIIPIKLKERHDNFVARTLASPFTPMASPLTPMASPFTPMASPLTPMASPFTPMASPLTPMASPLTPMASPLTPMASPFTLKTSLLKPMASPCTPLPSSVSPLAACRACAFSPRAGEAWSGVGAGQARNTLETSTKSKMQQQETEKLEQMSLKRSVFPIPKMGTFFSDSFFKDSWQDFQEAVKEVVSRWGDLTSTADPLTHYRRLRATDLRQENQAVKSSEDEHYYKFVVDVQDFMNEGEISVQFKNPRELVVDGHVEHKASNSKAAKKFLHKFVLPAEVDMDAASSVISADGVLTVTAPKKTTPLVREIVLPVTLEAGVAAEARIRPSVGVHTQPESRVTSPILRPDSEPEPRVTSPTPSVMSDDSCDSLGRLWTLCPHHRHGVVIEEL